MVFTKSSIKREELLLQRLTTGPTALEANAACVRCQNCDSDVYLRLRGGEEDAGKKDGSIELATTESKPSMRSLVRLFFNDTTGDCILHAIGTMAAIGAGTALPFMTLIFGKLVTVFNGSDGQNAPFNQGIFRQAVAKNALWFVFLFIGKFILVYIHTLCFTIAGTRIVRGVRLKYLYSLLRQDITYFDTSGPGGVTNRVTINSNRIYLGIADKLGSAIQAVSMFFAAFILAFVVQWKLTLVSAVTFPGLMVAMGFTVSLDSKVEAKLLAIYGRCGSLAEEVLGSIRTVVAFGAGERLAAKYNVLLLEAMKEGMKKGPIIGLQFSIQWFVMYCGYALSFWYGIHLHKSGEISDPGTIVTVFFSVLLATTALTQVGPNFEHFANAAAAAEDFHTISTRKPPIDSQATDGVIPQSVLGRIELKGVGFHYSTRPDVEVLSNVSLSIPEHKVTALVGPSGSGKSTVIGLLERWYDPTAGDIYLDGTNIKELNIKSLRGFIGLVQQEPALFNCSVLDNVSHGLIGTEYEYATEDKKLKLVQEACVKANADMFIQNLPAGYHTNVGSKGCLLSVGQKQRIAIARSIVADPPLLLLDEATSSLDSENERMVQAALDKATENRTTVVIAHRLATIMQADNIVVLEKGRIIEQGTREELMTANGVFARLVRAQFLGLEDGPGSIDNSKNDNHGGQNDNNDNQSNSTAVNSPDSYTSPYNFDFSTTDMQGIQLKPLYCPTPPQLTMERSQSMHEHFINSIPQSQTSSEDSRKLSLLQCLLILGKEQRYHWPIFAFGMLACLIAGGAFPAQAVLFSRLVGVFQLPLAQLIHQGNFWALMFVVLAFTTLLSYAVLGYFMTRLGSIVSRFYRNEYFRSMINQDIAYFDENASSSAASRLSVDPSNLQELISSKFGLIAVVIVDLVSCSVLSIAVGWKLGLVALVAVLPPIFGAGYLRLRLDRSLSDETTKTFEQSTCFAAEAVSMIRTVSSLTMEAKICDNYAQRLSAPVQTAFKRSFVIMIFFALSESIDLLAMAMTFWYGGQLMSTGEYTTNQFFSVFIAIIFGGQAAGFLFGFSSNFNVAHSAANNIINLRNNLPVINSSHGEPLVPDYLGEVAVEFKDVNFAYPVRLETPVLRGLNLKILRGQQVAIVGTSGNGKTTIISLLERFYDIQGGELNVFGQSISKIDITQHRSRVALVSQEPALYQGSIRDNVLLGVNEEVSEETLIQACKDANIHDFIISLPEGYSTECGSGGLALSGGQRQRIAIARALIRNPQILLLDEATSALDTESEQAVREALQRASKNRTVISVAHRLSTVQAADIIFVLEKGIVAESGTHSELLALGGRYYNMCQYQSLEE